MSKLLAYGLVVANDCVTLQFLLDRNVFAICLTRRDTAELLPKSLVGRCPAHAFGSPCGVIETLVSRPCSLTFGESMHTKAFQSRGYCCSRCLEPFLR